MNTPDPQQPDIRVLIWFGWGLVAFGAPLVLFGIYFALLADESQSWPKVEGTVTSSNVRTHVSVSQATEVVSDNDRTYYPEWVYKYTVDGQDYSSSRYALGESAPDHGEREDAQKAASAHPAGSKMDVFHDPADPSSAVLRPGSSTGSWVPLLLGLFFGGVGWWMLSLVRKLTPAAGTPRTELP